MIFLYGGLGFLAGTVIFSTAIIVLALWTGKRAVSRKIDEEYRQLCEEMM